MAFNANNVIATSNMKVFIAPFLAANSAPANTISYGTAWGANYVESGYTGDGLHMRAGKQSVDIRVDQEADPVWVIPTGRTVEMRTNYREMTPANIRDASGMGTASATAATTGVRGFNDLDIDSTLTLVYVTVGFDMQMPSSGLGAGIPETARIIGWKGTATGEAALDFGPNAAAQVAATWRLLPDTSVSPGRVAKYRVITQAA